MAIGALFALPAVRVRGVNLAIVTLGLGEAVGAIVFNNANYTGGLAGTSAQLPRIFGWNFDPILHPNRYSLVVLLWLTLCGFFVANLRRSAVGRNLLAVRTNERGAAALGVNVVAAKVYGFAISAGVAGLAGVLYGYQSSSIVYGSLFVGTLSITIVIFSVIGGVGYVGGAIIGSLLAPGGLVAKIGSTAFSNFGEYLPLIGGIILIINLMEAPDGLIALNLAFGRKLMNMSASSAMLSKHLGGLSSGSSSSRPGRSSIDQAVVSGATRGVHDPNGAKLAVTPMRLEVCDITVRFGGVTAVDAVSLCIETGRIVGLIGPNGAGKSTLIDVITGFTRPVSGDILLNGRSGVERSPHEWARAGVSRSFQALELFEDMTVAENLQAAADQRRGLNYVLGPLWPGRQRMTDAVVFAVREFGLADVLERPVGQLPNGTRRLAAIARAIATGSSLLLLDEPAAGLSDDETDELARVVRRITDRQGVGVLLVEHDMRFVMSVCDEVVVLNFGRVICRGSPAEVRANPAVVGAYLGEEESEIRPEGSPVGYGGSGPDGSGDAGASGAPARGASGELAYVEPLSRPARMGGEGGNDGAP
jgi:sulfate-transporting ATPase